jgi:hypothetical protein
MLVPLAALLCLISMTPIPTTANVQSATSALSSAQSAEVQSLKNDSQRFQSDIDRLGARKTNGMPSTEGLP